MLHCDQFWDQNTDLKSNAVRLVDSFAQSWTPPTAASGLNLSIFSNANLNYGRYCSWAASISLSFDVQNQKIK